MNKYSLEIPDKLLRKIKDHARSAYPAECCGILFGNHYKAGNKDERVINICEVTAAENLVNREGQKRYFVIDSMFIYRTEREAANRGLDIVGFYHSHPDAPAVLSGEDEEGMIPGQVFMILSAAGDGQTAREVTECTAWIKTDNIVNNIEFSLKEES